MEYLKKHKKVSEFDSENLMGALIEDVLLSGGYTHLDYVSHFPMRMLIKDLRLLNEDECKYAMNAGTHIDFLLYNRISKKPVLAIEVDGYDYHKTGTDQSLRDLKKNHILELYELPLLRMKTNGSGEKERLLEVLKNLMK